MISTLRLMLVRQRTVRRERNWYKYPKDETLLRRRLSVLKVRLRSDVCPRRMRAGSRGAPFLASVADSRTFLSCLPNIPPPPHILQQSDDGRPAYGHTTPTLTDHTASPPLPSQIPGRLDCVLVYRVAVSGVRRPLSMLQRLG